MRKLLTLLLLAPAIAGAFVISPGIAVVKPSEAAITEVEKLGFNLIRMPYTGEPDEKLVKFAVQKGLRVVLDYHRTPTDPFEIYSLPAKWADWAKTFSGYSSEQVAFELINEPRMGKRVAAYDAILTASIEAIREVSPSRWIVISNPQMSDPDWHDGPLLWWKAPKYKKLVITMHYYRAQMVTHDRSGLIPVGGGSAFDRKDWGNREIHFSKLVNWARENDCVPWIGEAGCWETVPGRVGWFQAVYDIARAFGVDVCGWGYDDRYGLRKGQPDYSAVLKIMLGK